MNLVNDQLIGVENYGIWSLCANNKLAIIDGSYSRPAIGSPMLHQWERCNALALSWIMNTVSKEIFGGMVYASDASTVWAYLKEQSDKMNGSMIFSLHREIGLLTQGNTTISNYYCRLKQSWDDYSALITLPSCECDTAKKYLEYEQQQRLLQFLMGLNDSYMNVRSQILMMNPLPRVGQAFSLLSQEESHRTFSTTGSPVAAFYTKQSKNDNSAKEVTCEYCHWNGKQTVTGFGAALKKKNHSIMSLLDKYSLFVQISYIIFGSTLVEVIFNKPKGVYKLRQEPLNNTKV
ncbi:hypothetical protein F511_05135 [Dorcoceras hygrometricum]|uniref:Uncharacterized protein n=1 Tax=Dorcoceras hygrometricum TaxID=472368 RepID=A0A2Z7C8B6_9LAMI|nr:hypothetical protein F511_05135 [Dorcoceras hygrometricum]